LHRRIRRVADSKTQFARTAWRELSAEQQRCQ
jgi:hypothetical protein